MKNHSNSTTRIFARKIAELRKERQFTQAELAEKIGMKRGVVAYYEANAKNPTVDTVQRFADFFGVSVAELLTENSENSSSPGPVPKLNRQVARIRNLSPARQRMISKAIDVLIDG